MKILVYGNLYESMDYSNPIKGGVGDNYHEYDPHEMKLGIQIEKEHVGKSGKSQEEIEAIARDIARDHLKEIKDYYTRLIHMEKQAKSESK